METPPEYNGEPVVDEQQELLKAYKLAAADRQKRLDGYRHDMALAQEAAAKRWNIEVSDGTLTIKDPE